MSSRLAAQEGFTVVELSVALLMLTVGVFSLVLAFDASRRLSLVSERHAAMVHVGRREIENVEGLPYAQIALNGTPQPSSDPTNPDYYVVSGSPPTLEWNRTPTSQEPLITPSQVANGAVTPVSNWSQGQPQRADLPVRYLDDRSDVRNSMPIERVERHPGVGIAFDA